LKCLNPLGCESTFSGSPDDIKIPNNCPLPIYRCVSPSQWFRKPRIVFRFGLHHRPYSYSRAK
jgi:hypothetical protein